MSASLSVCLSLFACVSLYLTVYLSSCLSVCPSVCLFIFLSFNFPVFLSSCFSISLSVCLSVCRLTLNKGIFIISQLILAFSCFLLAISAEFSVFFSGFCFFLLNLGFSDFKSCRKLIFFTSFHFPFIYFHSCTLFWASFTHT